MNERFVCDKREIDGIMIDYIEGDLTALGAVLALEEMQDYIYWEYDNGVLTRYEYNALVRTIREKKWLFDR